MKLAITISTSIVCSGLGLKSVKRPRVEAGIGLDHVTGETDGAPKLQGDVSKLQDGSFSEGIFSATNKRPRHAERVDETEQWEAVFQQSGLPRNGTGITWITNKHRWDYFVYSKGGTPKGGSVSATSCDVESVKRAYGQAIEKLNSAREEVGWKPKPLSNHVDEWTPFVEQSGLNGKTKGIFWEKKKHQWVFSIMVNGTQKKSAVKPSACDVESIKSAYGQAIEKLQLIRAEAGSTPRPASKYVDEWTSVIEQSGLNGKTKGIFWENKQHRWRIGITVNGRSKYTQVTPKSCDLESIKDAYAKALAKLNSFKAELHSISEPPGIVFDTTRKERTTSNSSDNAVDSQNGIRIPKQMKSEEHSDFIKPEGIKQEQPPLREVDSSSHIKESNDTEDASRTQGGQSRETSSGDQDQGTSENVDRMREDLEDLMCAHAHKQDMLNTAANSQQWNEVQVLATELQAIQARMDHLKAPL